MATNGKCEHCSVLLEWKGEVLLNGPKVKNKDNTACCPCCGRCLSRTSYSAWISDKFQYRKILKRKVPTRKEVEEDREKALFVNNWEEFDSRFS